jgi:hypothetical protein
MFWLSPSIPVGAGAPGGAFLMSAGLYMIGFSRQN